MVKKETIKRIAKKEYAVMKKPILTPLNAIILILKLIHDTLTADSIIDMISGITLTFLLIFSGLNTNDAKELLLRIKTIFEDPKKKLVQKIAEVFNVVVSGCATLGILHEKALLEYPIENFVTKMEKEKEE